MQEHIRGAGRHRSERGADDTGDREIRLDDIGLEIFVEELGDRHGPEAQGLRHLGSAQAGELLAEIKQFAEVARLQARRVWSGAHQEGLDEAALPCNVAGVAVVGLRIARREARELAAVRVMVAVVGEVVAVLREHRAALIGDDLQSEARQFEVAHDFGPEQRADIGTVGVEETRRQRSADRRAADPVVLLQHQHVEPGALKIAGVDEAVMPAADDDGVPVFHRLPSRPQIS